MPIYTLMRALWIALWFILKPIVGWFFIVIGLIGMPMPIVNGAIFLFIGLAIVGHRNRLIRWSRVHIKLILQWWAASEVPIFGWLGRLAQSSANLISRQTRRIHWWWRARQRARRIEAIRKARLKARSNALSSDHGD